MISPDIGKYYMNTPYNYSQNIHQNGTTKNRTASNAKIAYNTSVENDNTTKSSQMLLGLEALALSINKISNWVAGKLMNGKEFTTAENVKKVAEHMMQENNLNVKVHYVDHSNKSALSYAYGLRNELEAVASGQNAFYADSLKLAVAPKSKPSLILHELGHAINANSGKFLKFLQGSRAFTASVPVALLFLNFAMPKKEDNKPNFVERNAMTLGFLSFLPTIIEEGIASLRGIANAKTVLGKGINLRALKKNYAFAWMTYVFAGIGLGIAAKATILEHKSR